MKGVFLAAGRNRRFDDLDIPKSLIPIGNKTLIEHSLDSVAKAGIRDATIIVGHQKDKIKDQIRWNYRGMSVQYIENSQYLTTDTMTSLYMMKDRINDATIVLEADLLYDNSMIEKMIESEHENLIVVSELTNTGDEVLVSSRDGNQVDNVGKNIDRKNIIGEFIGASKLSREYVEGLFEFFEQNYLNNGQKFYCEDMFLLFSKFSGRKLAPFLIPDLIWTEIDTKEDLERAEKEIYPRLKWQKK